MNPLNRKVIQFTEHPLRRGVSSLEVLVAFTLLSTLLGVSTSLMVKHGRLVQTQRQYRIALDELSNQIEQLSALPVEDVERAIDDMRPSEFAARQLPGAQLKAHVQSADVGQRVKLQLWWDEPQRKEAPVTLVTWITPRTESDARTDSAGDRP